MYENLLMNSIARQNSSDYHATRFILVSKSYSKADKQVNLSSNQ